MVMKLKKSEVALKELSARAKRLIEAWKAQCASG